jgi:hypothetical protein
MTGKLLVRLEIKYYTKVIYILYIKVVNLYFIVEI